MYTAQVLQDPYSVEVTGEEDSHRSLLDVHHAEINEDVWMSYGQGKDTISYRESVQANLHSLACTSKLTSQNLAPMTPPQLCPKVHASQSMWPKSQPSTFDLKSFTAMSLIWFSCCGASWHLLDVIAGWNLAEGLENWYGGCSELMISWVKSVFWKQKKVNKPHNKHQNTHLKKGIAT